jgi:hypothetical protein
MLTPQQAQRFLASKLPETLTIYKNPSTKLTTIFWVNDDPRFVERVHDTEWDYIARQVELKLTHQKKQTLALLLIDQCGTHGAIFSDYITRATALKEIH